MVSDARNEWYVECSGHSHQIGERLDLHLAHDLASVGFHRDLTACESQAAGELPDGPRAANPPAKRPQTAGTFVTGETLHSDGGEAGH